MTSTKLPPLLLAWLGSLATAPAQSVEAHASTLWNCLQQPDGGRQAAPCLRRVPLDQADAVFGEVLAACRRRPDDVCFQHLVQAAALVPDRGVKLLADVLERGAAAAPRSPWDRPDYDDTWLIDYLDAALPHADAAQLRSVMEFFVRRVRSGHPDFAVERVGRNRLRCRFAYVLRHAEDDSATAEELVARVWKLCNERGMAIFACRLVATDARFVSLRERVLAAFAADDRVLANAVGSHIDRLELQQRADGALWPDDPAAALAWLFAQCHPLLPSAQWGHVLSLVGGDAAARAWAVQCLFANAPPRGDTVLVPRIAQSLCGRDAATQRAFGRWMAGHEDLDRVRWLVTDAVQSWPEPLRQELAAVLGRWRSPVLQSCQVAIEDPQCSLAVGPELAVEFVAEGLQRLAAELQAMPMAPISPEEVESRWRRLWGSWRDLAEQTSREQLYLRLATHLRAAPDEPALVPRLCRLVLQVDPGDEASVRALVLAMAVGQGPAVHARLAIPAMVRLTQNSMPQSMRMIVIGDPVLWTALAELARDVPWSFNLCTLPTSYRQPLPEWAIAARFASRPGDRTLSPAQCGSLRSLFASSGRLTRTRCDGKPLFLPAASTQIVDAGVTWTRFLLRAAP